MFSTSGDPDVFVSYDDSRAPDLLRNMMSDQRCDTCAVDGPYEQCDPCDDDMCSSNVQGCFSKNLIDTTRAVIIGVHVSCCQPASFTIKFTGPSVLFIAFRILMFVLAALVLFFLIWKKRHPIVAFYRNVSSRCRRSTTRPRLPNFTNAFNFRHVRRCCIVVVGVTPAADSALLPLARAMLLWRCQLFHVKAEGATSLWATGSRWVRFFKHARSIY